MGRHQLGRDLEPEQVRLIVAFLGSLSGTLPEYAVSPSKQVASSLRP
jgi:cytochrome c peroxidase